MTTQEILQGVHDWTNGKIVYNISAAHPDGQGNPTPYANLAAALGTNGANVPDALRKGGMSIKFVHSVDNKYVQYRLMATAFSTIESDWQKFDFTTAGITEGNKTQYQINNEVRNKIDKDFVHIIQPAGLYPNGTVLATNETLQAGIIIHYHFTCQTGKASVIEILDTNNARITSIGKGSSASGATEYEGTYTIPNNFGSLKVNSNGNGITIIDLYYTAPNENYIVKSDKTLTISGGLADAKVVGDRLNTLDDEAEDIDELVEKYIKDEILSDGLYANGVELFTSSDVPPETVIYYDFTIKSNGTTSIQFLDSNNAVITSLGKTSSGSPVIHYNGIFRIPSNFAKAVVQSKSEGVTVNYFYSRTINPAFLLKHIEIDDVELDKDYLVNGNFGNGDSVFTKDDVTVGKSYHYDVLGVTRSSAFIELFDSSGTKIASYGKKSTSTEGGHYTGDFVITQDFEYATFSTNISQSGGGGSIVKISLSIYGNTQLKDKFDAIDDRLEALEDVSNEMVGIDAESIETDYNDDIPSYSDLNSYNSTHLHKLTSEIVFSKYHNQGVDDGGSNVGRRGPCVIITNDKTILAVCINKISSNEDEAFCSCIIARKPLGSNSWSYDNTTIPADATLQIKRTEPSFIVDRLGAITEDGTVHAGRIYVFYTRTQITQTNVGSSTHTTAEEVRDGICSQIYRYSDDDGITWSEEKSINSRIDTSKWIYPFNSPSNGIQIKNGTIIMPVWGMEAGHPADGTTETLFTYCHSGIVYKTPNGDWTFSSPTTAGDNECTVVETSDNNIILDCRTPTGDAFRHNYSYNFSQDSWTALESTPVRATTEMQIIKFKANGCDIYLRSAPDNNKNNYQAFNRDNPTLYISFDCINWTRLLRLYTGGGGYTCVDVYKNKAVFISETSGFSNINIFDISAFITDIVSSYSFIVLDNNNVSDELKHKALVNLFKINMFRFAK